MKSNKKKINIFSKIRDAYRKFMYKEEAIKEMEELDRQPFKVRFKKRVGYYIWATVAIVSIIFLIIGQVNKETAKNKMYEPGVYITKELVGNKKQISSGKMTSYMIDTISNSDIKIALTKLDDNIAYSVTYNYDVIPEGEMVGTKYYKNGNMTSLLINGYPNVTYQEMGLESEEEAYIATQLAVYELVSQKQYSTANGEFSLDKIQPSKEKYKDMVERVVAKAKEIYKIANENPYSQEIDSNYYYSDAEFKVNGDEGIIGPFSITSTTDENTKKILGEKYNLNTKVEVKSFVDDSKVNSIDKEGNVKEYFDNGEEFYIKVDGATKTFLLYKTISEIPYLSSYIYETKDCDKKYTILQPKTVKYIDVDYAYNNIPVGYANIKFTTEKDNIVEGISYYIYDEYNVLYQDMDGFASDYGIGLPAGKYYIKVYDIPEGYFLDESIQEFEVKEEQETNLNLKVDSINY